MEQQAPAIPAPDPAPVPAAGPTPQGVVADDPEPVSARVDEAVAFFLLDSMQARSILRERGAEQLAERFWLDATDFAAIVNQADPDNQPLFLPLIAGLRATLDEKVNHTSTSDIATVEGLIASLEEQIGIQTAPGVAPGDRGAIQVKVTARRNGQPVSGYYAWFDLSCCVNRKTAYAVAQALSPATATVLPGKYRVRIVDASNRPAGEREAMIGKTGTEEAVDVVLQP